MASIKRILASKRRRLLLDNPGGFANSYSARLDNPVQNTKEVFDAGTEISTAEEPSAFTAHTPSTYVPRVTGVAGHGMDSAFGTAADGESTARIRIQRVTTTSDGTGAGTLREAIALPSSTRTVVVFDVSGWHTIGGNTLTLNNGNKTLAFNTAPSPGYYIKGGEVRIKTTDVLLWHLGVANGGPYNGDFDSIGITTGAGNVALINCAAWFGADETLTASAGTDITLYNSVIAHGLGSSSSSQQRGTGIDTDVNDLTFARNMWIHHRARVPLHDGQDLDFFNNIIANFDPNQGAVEIRDDGVAHSDNLWHNIFVQGPDTANNETCVITVNNDGGGFTGSMYYPTSLNKYVGTLTELDNTDGMTLEGSSIASAIAEGVNVTNISSWTDAETIERITNNIGPRPADRIGYMNALVNEVTNMEDGAGSTGSLAGDDPLNAYNVGGSEYDTLASNTTNNFQTMEYDGVFDNATLIDSGTNYRVYDFPVTDGITDLDTWLNDTANEAVMNSGWKT